jgi:hypothetical protein
MRRCEVEACKSRLLQVVKAATEVPEAQATASKDAGNAVERTLAAKERQDSQKVSPETAAAVKVHKGFLSEVLKEQTAVQERGLRSFYESKNQNKHAGRLPRHRPAGRFRRIPAVSECDCRRLRLNIKGSRRKWVKIKALGSWQPGSRHRSPRHRYCRGIKRSKPLAWDRRRSGRQCAGANRASWQPGSSRRWHST